MRQLGNEYVGAVISEGTLLDSDLIPKFESVLKNNYSEEELEEIDFQEPDFDTEDIEEMEDIFFYFEYLFSVLEEISPEGTYFGTHEGDGCLYGFWQKDEEENLFLPDDYNIQSNEEVLPDKEDEDIFKQREEEEFYENGGYKGEEELSNEELVDKLFDTLLNNEKATLKETDVSEITFPVNYAWFGKYVNNPEWKPFADADGQLVVEDLELRKDLLLITDCQDIQGIFEHLYGLNVYGYGIWGCLWVRADDGEIKEVFGGRASTPYLNNVVYLLYKLEDEMGLQGSTLNKRLDKR